MISIAKLDELTHSHTDYSDINSGDFTSFTTTQEEEPENKIKREKKERVKKSEHYKKYIEPYIPKKKKK